MQYELLYLVGASKEADLEKIKKEISNIVALEGGTFEEKQTEERRKLSYEIKHETHGTYIAQRFEMEDPEKIQSITGKLNLHQGILRSIISKASELPELRTKEERIKASEKRQIKKEEAKPASPKEEKNPDRKEKADNEDIDKKLEEILNI